VRSSSRPTTSRSRTARFASPSDELEAGLDLIRRGEYFAAHEELEDAWRAAPTEERDFYQGLVHVAVAWYQAGRGNRVGCERQLEKAGRRLVPYMPEHLGVNVASILEQVEEAAGMVAAGSLELPTPRV
jgi:predicted metal-dependent hydrolase